MLGWPGPPLPESGRQPADARVLVDDHAALEQDAAQAPGQAGRLDGGRARHPLAVAERRARRRPPGLGPGPRRRAARGRPAARPPPRNVRNHSPRWGTRGPPGSRPSGTTRPPRAPRTTRRSRPPPRRRRPRSPARPADRISRRGRGAAPTSRGRSHRSAPKARRRRCPAPGSRSACPDPARSGSRRSTSRCTRHRRWQRPPSPARATGEPAARRRSSVRWPAPRAATTRA